MDELNKIEATPASYDMGMYSRLRKMVIRPNYGGKAVYHFGSRNERRCYYELCGELCEACRSRLGDKFMLDL